MYGGIASFQLIQQCTIEQAYLLHISHYTVSQRTMFGPESRPDRVVLELVNRAPKPADGGCCDCCIKGGQEMFMGSDYSAYFSGKASIAGTT